MALMTCLQGEHSVADISVKRKINYILLVSAQVSHNVIVAVDTVIFPLVKSVYCKKIIQGEKRSKLHVFQIKVPLVQHH